MPPGREKDSSDRFHPATRKASTVLRENCFCLFLSPSLHLYSLSAPPSYRRRFFLAFKTGSGREDNGLHHRATERSTRKRSYRSRSNSSNRAVSSLLEDHFARATFARKSSSRGEGVFIAKPPPRGIYCHWGSPAVATPVNRYTMRCRN